jgi:ribosomal protein S18 acetylase RimI-like enzyme
MPVLQPMGREQYVEFIAEAIAGYAADKVASGQWSPVDADDRSRQEFHALLPDGLATPDNYLYSIVDEDAAVVGLLWFSVQERAGQHIAYVYDVSIGPQYRRQGHASRAFKALESEVTRLGLSGIALHVFGHNTGALALYERLGFRATNISMFKAVGPLDA